MHLCFTVTCFNLTSGKPERKGLLYDINIDRNSTLIFIKVDNNVSFSLKSLIVYVHESRDSEVYKYIF